MIRPFVLAFHKQNSGVSHHRTFAPLICHKDVDVFFIEKITDIDPEMWPKSLTSLQAVHSQLSRLMTS
jgi:hypothetical protein